MTAYAWALPAALLGSLSSAIPGLHVLNVLAVLAMLTVSGVDPGIAIAVSGALLGAYVLTSCVPACLLSAPDESAFFTVMPAQQLLREGRAGQALALSALGTLAGLLVVLLLLLPPIQHVASGIHAVLRRHQYWVLWAAILYLMQSEWPRGRYPGQSPTRALARTWRQIAAGLLVFLACGLLGCLTFYGALLPPQRAFQGLMPVFIGLFASPWLLSNMLAPSPLRQQQDMHLHAGIPFPQALRATASGALGGSVAAAIPGVTGGVGGWMAGQLLGTHQARTWLVAQATTRTVYYLGSCALLFVPGIRHPRGGAAWLLSGAVPTNPHDGTGPLLLYMACCSLGVLVARALLPWIGNATAALAFALGPHRISLACLLLLSLLVVVMTGVPGVLLLLTASALGLMPQLLGCKRMHLLGVILIPIALNLSGLGAAAESILGVP